MKKYPVHPFAIVTLVVSSALVVGAVLLLFVERAKIQALPALEMPQVELAGPVVQQLSMTTVAAVGPAPYLEDLHDAAIVDRGHRAPALLRTEETKELVGQVPLEFRLVNETWGHSYALAPNGRRVAYVDPNRNNVFVSDGRTSLLLTRDTPQDIGNKNYGIDARVISWSPDATKLLYWRLGGAQGGMGDSVLDPLPRGFISGLFVADFSRGTIVHYGDLEGYYIEGLWVDNETFEMETGGSQLSIVEVSAATGEMRTSLRFGGRSDHSFGFRYLGTNGKEFLWCEGSPSAVIQTECFVGAGVSRRSVLTSPWAGVQPNMVHFSADGRSVKYLRQTMTDGRATSWEEFRYDVETGVTQSVATYTIY